MIERVLDRTDSNEALELFVTDLVFGLSSVNGHRSTSVQSYSPLPEVELERRVAPRFQMAFEADIAAGDELLPVLVHDMSMTGCGLEIVSHEEEVSHAVGTTYMLKLPPGESLPVVVCYARHDGERLRVGLRFGQLIKDQLRALIGVIDAMMWR